MPPGPKPGAECSAGKSRGGRPGATPEEAGAQAAAPSGEKLQKVLARTGLGSRREMERWIEAGRVSVDGRVARLGDRVGNKARLSVDGKPLQREPASETRCIVYHKPTGEVCSRSDPEGRRTVFQRLPQLKKGRWIAIGRLDFNTSGLLLFTTDGELANALMHPSREVEREYVCRVFGAVTDEHLRQLRDGVELEDGPASFDDILEIHRDEKHAWFRVMLREGRNREVRRLWEALGMMVSRLKRIRYGSVELPRDLRRGHYRALDADQV
ncbi:MAG: pseudouridine synthase, partial [Halioglobus sp.]|nr:pseudouridine synthase [Halioglobus sp.]